MKYKQYSSDDITTMRTDILKSLLAKLEQAKARISFLETRIAAQGIESRFSINEDLLSISQKIWAYCYELSILRKLSKETEK